jgi:hypothetical protein
MTPSDLIRYICWYATQRDMRLTTVRLVKFVYLADLYYARKHRGKTITGFPWAFIYYGPYCAEVMREIDNVEHQGLICKMSLESKFDDKDFHLFSCHDDEAEELEDRVPTEVLYPLRGSIREYGEDTQALLDHVYFETEPMEGVKKGDLLDFTKARSVSHSRPIELKKLSKSNIERGRKHIANLREKMKKAKRNLQEEHVKQHGLIDEAYFQALEYLDEDDLQAGFEGVARIVLE